MDKIKEKLANMKKIDDIEEFFMRIKLMDKKKIAARMMQNAEERYWEELMDGIKEADFYNFFSEDSFSFEDIYETKTNHPKISVNAIIEKILDYTGILDAEHLSGKEKYGYREVAAYRDLLATIIYRGSLSLKSDSNASKSIADKTIKQDGSNILITNYNIAGLVIYVIFLAKSKSFCKYHSLFKSDMTENLKEHELKRYYKFYDRFATHINLNNMLFADALKCIDAWCKIASVIELLEKKLLSEKISFDKSEEIHKVLNYFKGINDEKAKVIRMVLHFDIKTCNLKRMSREELKDTKLQMLCNVLIAPSMNTIDEFESWIISDEKSILKEYLGKVSCNPKFNNYIENSSKEQRDFLFDKWESFKSIIDNEINGSLKG